jgi:hypothetical protein
MTEQNLVSLGQLVGAHKNTIKSCLLYGGIGLIALTHVPIVLMGACLGIGFWASRKFTEKVDERIALAKLAEDDKILDKKFG